MNFFTKLMKEMFGAPIPQIPGAPMAPLFRRTGKPKFQIRNQRRTRRKTGEGPTERANRMFSPAWHSWQNECEIILMQHHSHPHLHHLRDGLIARGEQQSGTA